MSSTLMKCEKNETVHLLSEPNVRAEVGLTLNFTRQ